MVHSEILTNFDQDRFNRKEIAEALTRFIKTPVSSVNDASLVIGLDSGWGTGKSSFINMWKKKLENDGESFSIVIYNAWENDDCSEAIIPIICSLQQLLDGDSEKDSEKKKKILSAVRCFAPPVINTLTKNFLHIDIKDFEEAYNKYNESLTQTIFNEYSSLQNKKDTLRTLVEEFSSPEKPLLIFIDELDRCRPTFAIETLEAIKHFFDLKNVIFVFALDMSQLQKSIKVIYGNIDTMGYIQRFFDYQIHLPRPTSFTDFLKERLRLEGANFNKEIACLGALATEGSLSFRDLNVICKAYLNFYKERYIDENYSFASEVDANLVYLYFISLKYSNPLNYSKIVNKGVDFNEKTSQQTQTLFGYRTSTLEDTKSYYTEKNAQRSMRSMYNSKMDQRNMTDDEYKICNLFFDQEWELVKNHTVNMTVAQAIMNIIDYGFIYPRQNQACIDNLSEATDASKKC